MGDSCTDECSDGGCFYFGLVGIVIDKQPSKEFAKDLKTDEIDYVVKKVVDKALGYKPESGIVSSFWGTETKLIHKSWIVDLKDGSSYKHIFKIKKGKYAPKLPKTMKKPSEKALENLLRGSAMRELLGEAQEYLEGERPGHYFMLTCYSKGCCAFQGGKIRIKLDELENLVDDYRKKKN